VYNSFVKCEFLDNVPLDFHSCLTTRMKYKSVRCFEVECCECRVLNLISKYQIIKSGLGSKKDYLCKRCHTKNKWAKSNLVSDEKYLLDVHKSFWSYLSKQRSSQYSRLFVGIPCSMCGSLNTTTKQNLISKTLETYVCKVCRSILNGRKCRKYPQKEGERTTKYETLMFRKHGYDKKLWICENCLADWKSLQDLEYPYNTIQIHHIDFDRTHDVLENLKLLCYGCHNKLHYQSS
jgi:hypothetical protein